MAGRAPASKIRVAVPYACAIWAQGSQVAHAGEGCGTPAGVIKHPRLLRLRQNMVVMSSRPSRRPEGWRTPLTDGLDS
jgi:hypothetical protein